MDRKIEIRVSSFFNNASEDNLKQSERCSWGSSHEINSNMAANASTGP